MQPSSAARVFISHSWTDKPLARRMAMRIKHRNMQVFLDEEVLRAGQALTQSLKHEITNSTHLVVIWTNAAAESYWVKKELEFVTQLQPDGPVIIPFLLTAPEKNTLVADFIGIEFKQQHRFEKAFSSFVETITLKPANLPSATQAKNDLQAILKNESSLSILFKNPVVEKHDELMKDIANLLADQNRIEKTIKPELQDTLELWKPEKVPIAGLPPMNDPQFHAIDYALWCEAIRIFEFRDNPVELTNYPGLFTRIIGKNGAGYEALLIILNKQPGLISYTVPEILPRGSVNKETIPVVVDLFIDLFALSRSKPQYNDFAPYGATWRFIRDNREHLTDRHKNEFFRLIEEHAGGPYPGGPLDVLGELCFDPETTARVSHIVKHWIEDGKFDRSDPVNRGDSPSIFYGFVNALYNTHKTEAELLLQVMYQRIRKLFRSGNLVKAATALELMADADRLDINRRGVIIKAYREGVYSTEFESTPGNDMVKEAALRIYRDLSRSEDVSSEWQSFIEKNT